MSNDNINTLRSELFDTLRKLKNKELTPTEAKAVCDVGQTIINSAKLEIDYQRLTDSPRRGSKFISADTIDLPTDEVLQTASVFKIGGKQ